jgi:hypothetical protein
MKPFYDLSFTLFKSCCFDIFSFFRFAQLATFDQRRNLLKALMILIALGQSYNLFCDLNARDQKNYQLK